MRSAADRVCGSPIAVIAYGACSGRPVDHEAAGRPVDERGLRDDPHVADLQGLGPGVAQLLDDVEHGGRVDLARSGR